MRRSAVKQSLSAFLAVVMLLSLCPVPGARAEEQGPQVIWTQEVNQRIFARESTRSYSPDAFQSITFSDSASTGFFRVSYGEVQDGFDASDLTFAVQVGDSWTWKEESGTAGEGYVDFPISGFDSWDGTEALRQLNVKNNGENSIKLTGISYYTSAEDTAPVQLSIDEEEIPYSKSTEQYEVPVAAIQEKDPDSKGWFRISYRFESSDSTDKLIFQSYQSDYTYIGNTEAPLTEGAEYVDIPYKDNANFASLGRVSVQVWSGAATIERIAYYVPAEAPGPTPGGDDSDLTSTVLFTGNETIAAGSSITILTLSDVASKFETGMITSEGKFRLTCSSGDSGSVQFVPQKEWEWDSTVDAALENGIVDIPYASLKAKWSGDDFSGLTRITVKNNNSTDGANITITKLEWLGTTEFSGGEGPGPDEPDPPTPSSGLTVDENGVVTVPAFENQNGLDFTGKITPGGYFRVEYTLKSGGEDKGVQLTMEPSWVAVGDASMDKDGNDRKGEVSGKANTYFAEFTYADCEAAWKAKNENAGKELDNMTKVFPIYKTGSWNTSELSTYLSSYTVKYYPTDTKAVHPLGDGIAVVGTPVSAGVSGGSYQWYRVVGSAAAKGTAISGAASQSYTPTEADKGCWLYCVIDNQITAGPAAVVASKTNKTTKVFSGSKEVAGGDTAGLWTPASTESTFNKAMIVPGGSFRMKCNAPNTDVKLVLKEPWTEITGTVNGEYLVFDYEAITGQWKQNFANIGEIDVKNTGSSAVTILSLEWTGYDIGVEEAPYMPTDDLPYGGTAWERDWLTKTVTQDVKNNVLTAQVTYDGGEWSVGRLKTHSDTGFIVGDNNMVSLNVYLEKAAMDAGKGEMLFQIVDCTGEYKLNTSGEDGENLVTVDGKEYYRTPLNLPVSAFPARFNDFVLAIRGKNSTFDGTILVDSITLRKNEGEKDIQISEDNKNFTDGSAAVSLSAGTASAYYGDTLKVSVKLENKPAGPVKVTITLNDDQKTESSKDIPVDQFTQAGTGARMARAISGGWTAEAEVPVPCTVGEVRKIEVKIVGHSGAAELAGLKIVSKGDVTQAEGGGSGGSESNGFRQAYVGLPHTWNFNLGLDGWKYEPGWDSNYSGKSNTRAGTRFGRMEVHVDYYRDGGQNWSQMAVTLWHDNGMGIKNANHMFLDLYYQPEKLDGSLTMKVYSGGAGIDAEGSIDWDKGETVRVDETTYRKVRVEFDFSPIASGSVHDMALCIIGRNTTYSGSLLIGELTIEEEFAGSFVKSTRQAKSKNSTLRTEQNKLITASGEEVELPREISLADGKASASVRSVYAYLQAIGASRDVLFGQQYNFSQKAGSANLSDSDTYDMAGDYAAVFGLDALALTGTEFSAGRCNQLYGTPFPSTAEGNVVAAAYLTNTAIKRGAIVTLSCHMPNFSQVKAVTPNCSASYARYDFSGYTPNVLTGDTANEILPGGQYNDKFNAYLDMIADYANRVNGAVLFRPFHENTGSWFWWGRDFCDAETYKNVYRYTVEYLRDEKEVHNFLYVYGPGSEAESLGDYAERYPGDGYVDMVGFDMYDRDPDVNSGWMDAFKQELALVSQFAADHGKLAAVTETGAANDTVEGDNQTALLRTGNKDKDWFRRVLDVVSDSPASYLLVWANFGQTNGFYTPYVIRTEGRQLYGHEMMDNFIDYYNDPRSIFASDQKNVLGVFPAPAAKAASSFQDVPANAWYSSAVEYVAQKGIMSGVGGGLFQPGASITRAMMVQVLYSMEGKPEISEQSRFQDVAESAWYAPAVKWAVSKKIVTGYDDTAFGPEDKITREQMTVMLYEYAKMKKYDMSVNMDVSVFTDAEEISSWAMEAVRWAVGRGLLSGIGNSTLAPGSSAARAQLASILMRYYEKNAQ